MMNRIAHFDSHERVRGLILSLVLTCFAAGTAAQAEEESLKQGAKRAGHAAGSVVHDVGQGAKQVGKEVVQGVKQAGKTVGEAAKEGGKEFRKAVKGN